MEPPFACIGQGRGSRRDRHEPVAAPSAVGRLGALHAVVWKLGPPVADGNATLADLSP
jgi:hypothetical protein